MRNREIYSFDPSSYKLENDGVANVNSLAEDVLKYELQTFVCDGMYAKGLESILDSFLSNLGRTEQPAAWVSGFYGSGKSHLVKMLSVLWENKKLSNGAFPRDIANLPQSVKDKFNELSTQGRRNGGLHAARGTLSSGGEGTVRALIMGIIFKSVGLYENIARSRFVLWLREKSLEQKVRQYVETNGGDWGEELDNLYVAEILAEALVKELPQTFSNTAACSETLGQMFPDQKDVSNEEMGRWIKQALSVDGKMPLMLVVLDEAQQFIGDNTDRALLVQEAVETMTKSLGGKLLVVATGQSAISGTACLQHIEGRFPIRVELTANDINAVTRKVALAKKLEKCDEIKSILEDNIGEISRHLQNTPLAHVEEDKRVWVQDYPILPTRRRFWEMSLEILDQTGTDSQLRHQLKMTLKIVKESADLELGNVIPGDYLYFDLAANLLQRNLISRGFYDMVKAKYDSAKEDDRLLARACGLVFLLNQLASKKADCGLQADVNTIADLMVEDLNAGSGSLREKLPPLLDSCPELMKIGDVYQIQTKESMDWERCFNMHQGTLRQRADEVDVRRNDDLKLFWRNNYERCFNYNQGVSKEPRTVEKCFNDTTFPTKARNSLSFWIRDEWHVTESTVRGDAGAAGLDSHIVFAFLPKVAADEFRTQLITVMAAEKTLAERGTPSTPEGLAAKDAMTSRVAAADAVIKRILKEMFEKVTVYQGGGAEITDDGLPKKIGIAIDTAAKRLYSSFEDADNSGWGNVYNEAVKGVTDSLKKVGHAGETKEHPVCKQILAFIGAGKDGASIREEFGKPPYGWSKDAVEGALMALMVSGDISASKSGTAVSFKDLPRRDIGGTYFKAETIIITATQKQEIRRVFRECGIQTPDLNGVSTKVGDFLQEMHALAESAGGEGPLPPVPDVSALDEIERASGNAQLLAIFEKRDDLIAWIAEWKDLGKRIREKMGNWELLYGLSEHLADTAQEKDWKEQVESIITGRKLLEEPDCVHPLLVKVTDFLREKLQQAKRDFDRQVESGEERLRSDACFMNPKLTPEKRHEIREKHCLLPKDFELNVHMDSPEEILATLQRTSLEALRNKTNSLSVSFTDAIREAAKELEPKVQYPDLPSSGVLRTESDVDEWWTQARAVILEALKNGPVQL